MKDLVISLIYFLEISLVKDRVGVLEVDLEKVGFHMTLILALVLFTVVIFFNQGEAKGADSEAEIELTLEDAYRGGKKTITLSDGASSKVLTVNIPPGVVEGSKIRLAGQGQIGPSGRKGDLYLRVKLLPHYLFKVEGNNVILDLPLTPWEAALGCSVSIPTLDGRVELKVPPGTSSGQKLRLKGKGLGRGTKKGDFFCQGTDKGAQKSNT